MEQAVEYKKASDKLDTALATLKSELMALRNQDVKLMKTLITINDSIRQLSPKTKRRVSQRTFLYGNGVKKCVGVHLLPMTTVTEETQLVRRQSVPNFCKMNKGNNGSLSSLEDIGSSTEDLSGSDQEEAVSSSEEFEEYVPRPRSSTMSRIEKEIPSDDRRFEDILRQNVKIWKYANAEH